MSRLRILHVISGLDDGGAESVLRRLVLADRRHVHRVVSLTVEGKHGPLLRHGGIEVECLRMPRGRLTVRGLRRLAELVRAPDVDVVQSWMYHADLLAALLTPRPGPPVVWGVRTSSLERRSSSVSSRLALRACAVLSSKIPAAITCCASVAAQMHVERGYCGKKIVVIANGFDTSAFSMEAERRRGLRRAWGVDDQTPVLGMVARFDPQKDHHTMLEAFVRLRRRGVRAHLVLVGSGLEPANSPLAGLVDSMGVGGAVSFLGPRHDVPAIMGAIDLHVLSSAYGEAFPNVVAEAMASGTPCVVTDVGDAADIVGDLGWVVPPRTPSDLECAIAQALEGWQEWGAWQERRLACRHRIVERYSLEGMVAAFQSLWERCARQNESQ